MLPVGVFVIRFQRILKNYNLTFVLYENTILRRGTGSTGITINPLGRHSGIINLLHCSFSCYLATRLKAIN